MENYWLLLALVISTYAILKALSKMNARIEKQSEQLQLLMDLKQNKTFEPAE